MSGGRTLRVDPIMCHAHGLCAEILPELIRLDEWGYPVLPGTAVPPALHPEARRAVSVCPTLALRLVLVDAPEDEPAGAHELSP